MCINSFLYLYSYSQHVVDLCKCTWEERTHILFLFKTKTLYDNDSIKVV